jgi:hypothetical protein
VAPAVSEIQLRQEAVDAVYAAVFQPRAQTTARAIGTNGTGASPRDDADILRLARNAANREKFIALYDRGEVPDGKTPSEAVAALCWLIAFYTKDATGIDALFRGSALYPQWADKWERLGASTIDKAIAGVTETYGSRGNGAAPDEFTSTQLEDVIENTFVKYIADPHVVFSKEFLQACAVVGVDNPERLSRIRERLKKQPFKRMTEFDRLVHDRQRESERQKREQHKASEAAARVPSGAYIIETSDQYQLIATKAFAALQRANNPIRLVRYANFMTRVGETIDPLNAHSLRVELTKAINWFDSRLNPDKPTLDFANLLLAGENPPLPKVTRFARSPVFTKEGRLVVAPGYDAASGIFLLPHEFNLGVIQEKPSDEEVNAARDLLFEMVVNFPFEGDADRPNALGLPFERLMREMIHGPLPINLFDATTPGSGKGFLVRSLLGITNTSIAAWPEVENDAEMRKALTTFFMQGDEVVIIDNVKNKIKSGALALATTEPVWKDRLLSFNRDIVVKILNSWVLTANNPAFEKEFLRRCSRIRLAPKMEHPENRQPSESKHPDLLGWCAEHRDDLMRALLILAQNWIARGKPAPVRVPSLGSYESWSFVIGGILESAGIDGFQGNRGNFETDAGDAETELWRELVAQWWVEKNDGQVPSKPLFSIAEKIDGFPLKGDTEKEQRISFGISLGKLNGRVFRLTLEDDRSIDLEVVRIPAKLHSAVLWQLKLITKVTTPDAT